jgi:hypothetical protein
MGSEKAVQLIRIARLRRFVGVFARGGDREATAEALLELARAGHAAGFASDAVKRARQAAELLAETETGEAGVRALLQLASVCLETGATDSAASAAELARERAVALGQDASPELVACAALLAGIAHALDGAEEAARSELASARDLMVACNQPAGAALALVQQGLLDVAAERSEGADLCFSFARDFYRAARIPLAGIEVAAVAARAFVESGSWPNAERWFQTALTEADEDGAAQLAAELAAEYALELERMENRAEALRLATGAAQRCALLGDESAVAEMLSTVHLLLARLHDDERAALRHIEAVFELAITRRDSATIGETLDLLVSAIVNQRFSDAAWRLVVQFRDRLTEAEFDELAQTADNALADLQG